MSPSQEALDLAAAETVTRVLAEHGPDLILYSNACRCGAVIHDESQFRGHVACEVVAALGLVAALAKAKADALDEAADRIVAEMVCCNTYDGTGRYPHSHDLCYWAGASASLVRARAVEVRGGRSDGE